MGEPLVVNESYAYLELVRSTLQIGELSENIGDIVVAILENPAVGNLFLLLASIIGVAGSYRLYRKRRTDSRNKLRRALAYEIWQMDQIDSTAQNLENLTNGPPARELTSSSIPPAETFPTTIYEANAPELGRLPNSELKSVIDFYTSLIQHKGIIRGIRDNNRDVPMPDHEKIVEEFPELGEQRSELIDELGVNLGQDNE